MRRFPAILLLLVLTACGGPDESAPPAKPVSEQPPATSEAPDEELPAEPATPRSMSASIRVVDLAGSPLANMAPIVTREPNAFDAPVATGSATDGAGAGSISFPTDERLYLRAWDPGLNYFPNNFYEVLPGGGQIGDDLVIQMVPAASLSVQLLLPGDQLAADTTVGLMLLHPTRGPWWPAEGKTNGDGFVTFAHLPAGEFVLRFKVESGERLEYQQTALPPASSVDLGILTLQ